MSLNKPANWRKTAFTYSRLITSPHYEQIECPDGNIKHMFKGREIINRNTRINGNICVGTSPREAIVVDDQKDQILARAYSVLFARQKAKAAINGDDWKETILNEAFDLARELLPYDLSGVERVNKENGVEDDGKIQLGAYIVKKCGVCRHQALLVAYLLEKFIDDGYLQGTVSFNRNAVDKKGGHGFVRYTNSRGKVIIIDPAKGRGGLIEEMPNNKWDYRQPGELGLPDYEIAV